MKLKSLVFLITAFGSLSPANPAPVLRCQGGAGGPTPARSTVMMRKSQSGHYFIKLVLFNSAIPQGTSGNFVGQVDSATHWLYGAGTLAGRDSRLYVMPTSTGSNQIAIYAGGDKRIEFGYGAHLICK